jgi:hypothetical protein
MGKMIQVRLNEVGANRSLFGDTPRRLREQNDRGDHRERIIDAIAAAHREGYHDRAAELARALEEMDNGEEEGEELEEAEDLEDESQAGRGEPRKPLGQVNTAGSSRGKENMEGRQRSRNRHGVGLRESIRPGSLKDRRLKEWANRVLYS